MKHPALPRTWFQPCQKYRHDLAPSRREPLVQEVIGKLRNAISAGL